MTLFRVLLLAFVLTGCTNDNDGNSRASGGADAQGGSATSMDGPTDMASDPATGQEGLSNIGYLDTTVTYTPTVRSDARSIPLHIWYPTSDSKGMVSAYQTVFERESIFTGASIALSEKAPLLVFSHGRRGFGQYSYFMAEYFAERGWVVAAMDHVGDTLGDNVTPDDIFSVRPQDISATIDHMLNLPADDPLAGLISNQIVVAGHSFGGYTTLAIAGAEYDINYFEEKCPEHPDKDWCTNFALPNNGFANGFADPRVLAAIVMAPGNQSMFNDGTKAIKIPTLLVTAAQDKNNSDEDDGDPYWQGLSREPNRRLSFATGGHFTFTNICDSVFSVYGEGNGCGDGFIETNVAYSIVNQVAMAFVKTHVFGEKTHGKTLDGNTSLHPDVSIIKP